MFRGKYNPQARAKEELGMLGYTLQKKSNAPRRTAESNFADANGHTHVHQGITLYNVDDSLFESSLKVGCDVNAVDKKGQTALHLAGRMGMSGCVEKLLERGAKTDLTDSDDMTPLMYASQEGNLTVVKYLVNHGANVNQSNSKGELALHHSCLNGRRDCTELLLKHKAKLNYPDDEGNTPLIMACKSHAVSTIKVLLKAGAKFDKKDSDGRTPLHWAALSGDEQIVEILIKAGVALDDTDKKYITAFMYALFNNHAGVMKKLVTAGCDRSSIDGLNGTAIALAALKGYNDCTKILLSVGEDPDEFGFFGMTALMSSVYESHYNVVKILLEHGANVNVISRRGLTALYTSFLHIVETNAVARHRLLVLLIQNGADVNQVTNDYRVVRNTPLSFAISTGYISLVDILLKAGCKVNLTQLRETFGTESTAVLYEVSSILDHISTYTSSPSSLCSLCRSTVRASVGQEPYKKIQNLQIAHGLKEYLNFSDLTDVTPERVVRRSDVSDRVLEMLSLTACGLNALQGSLLFENMEEPVRSTTPSGNCQCDTCAKIRIMQERNQSHLNNSKGID